MIRVAAVGDLHFGLDSGGTLRPYLDQLPQRADVLLIAGDLTKRGDPLEAEVLADEIGGLDMPTIAVLGNHDYHSGQKDEVVRLVERAGVRVFEGESVVLEVRGTRLGIVGSIGFGGGFVGATGSEFGEPEMKAFMQRTRTLSERLTETLGRLDADVRVVLLHYAPIRGTLQGERLEIYPFLGSYLMAEAVDRVGADIVFHGHAHAGTEKGVTPGGIHVRNVAQPVIKHAYNLYALG